MSNLRQKRRSTAAALLLAALAAIQASSLRAGVLLWEGAVRNPLHCVPGAPHAHTEWFVDLNAAFASTCVAQTFNCGAAKAIDIVQTSATSYRFQCELTVADGGKKIVGHFTMRAAEFDEVKNAGPCGGDSERPCQQATDNPINLASGNKYLVETDYVGAGHYPLRLARYYNSGVAQRLAIAGVAISPTWRHSYERSVHYHGIPGGEKATVARPEGTAQTFTLITGVWRAETGVVARLFRLGDASGNPAGWQYVSSEDETELYDNQGRLVSITSRSGVALTLSYDTEGRLLGVSDPFGRSLLFAYNSLGRLASVTQPDGQATSYTYDSANNLASVTHADGKVRTYHYVPPTDTFNFLLTGITDENGSRFTTYGYYAADRSYKANLSERAGGVGRVSVQYSGWNAIVTDALGTVRTFTNANIQGSARNTGVSLPCPACEASSYGYDDSGFISYKVDFNGNRTNYTKSARGLETRRVEGLTGTGGATAVTRTTTTEWHPDYRLPTRIAEPLRVTTFTYGAPNDPNPGNRGNVLTKTLQATSDTNGSLGFGATVAGAPRTWTYTYDTNGQVLSVDGPRKDVSDVTTYTYHPNDATCSVNAAGASSIGCRGQVSTTTNPLGHVTRFPEYNAHGQPLRVVDSNGLVTTLSYDARMRLTSRDVGGELTSYAYDSVGQLIRITLPDSSYIQHSYDAAHRLIETRDSLGNRIVYTLDVMGNRTREDTVDPANQLAQTRSRVFNSVSRVSQEIGAQGQTTAYGYDNQGNVTAVDGPLAGTGDTSRSTYDALNRLSAVIDPAGGTVGYRYNALDQLTSVSDPRNLVTSYSYDGLGNLSSQASPDTGITTNTYDEAGNLLVSTDAKGQATRYTYDALSRVLRAEFFTPAGVLAATHAFTYDEGANQKGRLTRISEPNSTTVYSYDPKGRITSEARAINGVTYTVVHAYDAYGRLGSMSYPGGRQLAYSYDSLGRVQAITTSKNGVTQNVLSAVAYRPFGSPASFTFGNGETYLRGFDSDGRVTSYTVGNQTVAVGYDLGSRITSLQQSGTPTSSTYGYDALDRLTSYVGANANQAFTYDPVGNRLTKLVGASTSSYTYESTSNRLTSVSGQMLRTYTHDQLGSVTSDGVNTYAYDVRGRLTQAVGALGTTNYQVNALGQRVRKTNPEGDTVYHYDSQGRLIAESSATGAIRKEYIYLGDIPVAVLQ